jgi:hypothetical protein
MFTAQRKGTEAQNARVEAQNVRIEELGAEMHS